MTGKKLQVTYIPVSELETRTFPNPKDFAAQIRAQLHVSYAIYPDWNPSSVVDN
jgi:hypothetical protein